jgi:hypothetical protein
MSVASTYLASFQPVRPMLEGFGNVLSTDAAALLSSIPAQNAAMELALGKQALAEAGANRRQQMSIDAQLAQLEDARKLGALRMAGSLFGLGGGVGGGLATADPLQLKTGVDQLMAARRAQVASRGLRSNAYLAQAVENLA